MALETSDSSTKTSNCVNWSLTCGCILWTHLLKQQLRVQVALYQRGNPLDTVGLNFRIVMELPTQSFDLIPIENIGGDVKCAVSNG